MFKRMRRTNGERWLVDGLHDGESRTKGNRDRWKEYLRLLNFGC